MWAGPWPNMRHIKLFPRPTLPAVWCLTRDYNIWYEHLFFPDEINGRVDKLRHRQWALVLSPNNQNRSERNKKFSLSWSTHFSPICINSVYWIKFFIQNLIKRVGTRRLYNNKTFSANLLSLYWILLSSPLVQLQDNTGYKKTSRR